MKGERQSTHLHGRNSTCVRCGGCYCQVPRKTCGTGNLSILAGKELVKLDWKYILTVHSERRLQDVLDKHKGVLRGLRKLEGVQAKFHKARMVPYTS